MEHSTEMVGALQKIMTCFADAAENYVKEACYRHAETCVAHARLVALQVNSLLFVFRIISHALIARVALKSSTRVFAVSPCKVCATRVTLIMPPVSDLTESASPSA